MRARCGKQRLEVKKAEDSLPADSFFPDLYPVHSSLFVVEIISRLSGSNTTVMIEFPFKNTPVQVFILGKNSTFLDKENSASHFWLILIVRDKIQHPVYNPLSFIFLASPHRGWPFFVAAVCLPSCCPAFPVCSLSLLPQSAQAPQWCERKWPHRVMELSTQ